MLQQAGEKLNDKTLAMNTAFEKARCALDLSVETWADYMQISPHDYLQILEGNAELSAPSLKYISDRLQLNPSDLAKGYIDTDSLVQQQRGNVSFIHPRYLVAATSKKFTAINALNFVSKIRGPHLRTVVNRHFQIHDDFWRSGFNDNINIRFVLELFDLLRKNGLHPQDLRAIGWHVHLTLKNTDIETQLLQSRNFPELYEYAFSELIGKFEFNSIYSIGELKKDYCTIHSIPNPDVANALQDKHLATENGCLVRSGVAGSFASFLSSIPAIVTKTHCVLNGDPSCRFIVDYSRLKPEKQTPYSPAATIKFI